MELHICHMYPDLLNMYGDIGNVKILKYRAEKRGIEVNLHNLAKGERFEGETYDLVMLGGGQDFEMRIVSEDIAGEKKAALQAYMERDGVFLAVGSGYQLLGKNYVSGSGDVREGLGLLPFSTEPYETRLVGNIATEIDGIPCVGFENHAGKTRIGDMVPLGRVLSGFGNNGEDGGEGLRYKNTFCTFLHGPFLSKNPELADKLLTLALQRRYTDVSLEALDDTYEQSAKKQILNKLGL